MLASAARRHSSSSSHRVQAVHWEVLEQLRNNSSIMGAVFLVAPRYNLSNDRTRTLTQFWKEVESVRLANRQRAISHNSNLDLVTFESE